MLHKSIYCGLFCSTALALAAPVSAQTEGAEQPDSPGIGDIIVTAQKRSESINNVGMAIAALSGDMLTNKGVTDVKDLARVVPGFVFTQSQKGAPVYSLRGVGFYEESLGASPAVSIYVDEVGYAFPIMAKAAALDLERVEVLKGPQGTLFGQNSTGGAVNYIAAKPSYEFSAGMRASLDRFGRLELGGHVGGGLTSNLAIRIAAEATEGGAWQKSATRGEKNGDADMLKGRVLLAWEPSDTLRVNLNINGFRDRSDSLAASLIAVTPQTPSRQTPALLGQQPVPENNRLADWGTGYDLSVKEDFWQSSLRIEADVSDAITLTSITAYSDFKQDDFRDTDGSPLNVFAVAQDGSIKSLAQELRASGTVLDGALNYVVGGFYAKDKTAETNRSILPVSTSASPFVGITGSVFEGVDAVTRQTTETKAIFGNVDFDATDWLSFHAGARHSWTDISFAGCMEDYDGLFAPGINFVLGRINPGAAPAQKGGCVTVLANRTVGEPYRDNLNEQNTSWRIGVDLKPIKGTLLYATVSRGYKSGSFPNINATTFASFQPVTQESVTAYELGVKTDLGSRIAHLDASLFYYDYRDKQFRGRIVDPLGVFGAVEALVNVPKSRVKGAEVSLRVEPLTGLSLNGGVTYLDTQVTSDFSNYNPFGSPANFKGEAFPFTPKWTIQGGFDFEAPLTASINGFLGANASYRTSTVSAFGRNAPTSLYNYDLVRIASYVLVDAQAGIKDVDGKWQAALWVRNLGNRYYWTDAFRQIDNVSRHVGEPRTWGLRFSYDF